MEDFQYGMEMERKKITSVEYGKIVFHSIPYHALTIQHNPLQNTLVHIVFVISNIRGIVVKLFFPPPVLLSYLRSSVHKDSYGSR